MSADIASICRHLADLHGGLDLAERVKQAMDIQLEQRAALLTAAETIERQRTENAALKARIAELQASPPAA
jgi:hypothetical protein